MAASAFSSPYTRHRYFMCSSSSPGMVSLVEWHGPGSTFASCELGDALSQEAALGLLPGKRERPLIGRPGLGPAPEAPAQVGACRVRQVVALELAALEQRVHQREAGGRSIAHAHRDRAIELDHGRRFDLQPRVVEAH